MGAAYGLALHSMTLCRRRCEVAVNLPRRVKGDRLHVVIDATGIKVYGEREWKVRSHGWRKPRR